MIPAELVSIGQAQNVVSRVDGERLVDGVLGGAIEMGKEVADARSSVAKADREGAGCVELPLGLSICAHSRLEQIARDLGCSFLPDRFSGHLREVQHENADACCAEGVFGVVGSADFSGKLLGDLEKTLFTRGAVSGESRESDSRGSC